ncbi:MAG: hypothetical protein MIO92_14475 [Methanosarcinaceae archaeon]|nr:hypothetical protein [Methanosarcinaceae archaeon]
MSFLARIFGKDKSNKREPINSETAELIQQAFLQIDKGIAKMETGQLKNAYAAYKKALSVSESIISSDSNIADAYYIKATSAGNMGHIQGQLDGTVDNALFSTTIESWKKLLEVAPRGYNREILQHAKKILDKYSAIGR